MERNNKLTEFTQDRVEACASLMALLDALVAQRPDPDAAASDILLCDIIGEALRLYYLAGRTDVDLDAEYLSVTLRDHYRDAILHDGLTGASLKKEMIAAIAVTATSYVSSP